MLRKSLHFQERHLIACLTVLAISFLLYCKIGAIPGTAQTTTQESTTTTPSKERQFRNQIPPHLPIKIKIKNLNNERLLRDLEIEVTNKSDKPIYYLKLSIFFPGVIGPNGNQVGYPFRYGRLDLIDLTNRAKPEDVPLRPGETYVFKFSEQDWLGWEAFASKRNLSKSEPKKVGIRFQVLNFGDGTGYVTTSGLPIPKNKKQEQKIFLEPAKSSQVNPKEKAHAGVLFNTQRTCNANSLLAAHASFFFTGEDRRQLCIHK